MARPTPDLLDRRFGRLTVIRKITRDEFWHIWPNEQWRYRASWECLCDCGNYKNARAFNLTAGHIQSCGCLRLARVRERAARLKKASKTPRNKLGQRMRVRKRIDADGQYNWQFEGIKNAHSR